MNTLKLNDDNTGHSQSNVPVNGAERTKSSELQPSVRLNTEADSSEVDSRSPPVPTPLLPKSVNDPVPSYWLTIEDEFVTVVASLQTHLSLDSIVAPTARFDDGLIHLSYVRAGISRLKLVQIFSAMEEGRFIEDPHLEIVQVRAFRLVPLTEGGTLTVDGELVDYGPIQAQVLPSTARLML